MFSKIGKCLSEALTPKHSLRATRKKWLPKVAGGAMLVSGGIAVDKTIGLIEGKDEYILDYSQDDVNIVNKSF